MSDHQGRPRPMPETIAGHYRTVTELGAGGMGRIYKAIDTRLNRAVAIKAIHDDRLRHTDAGQRLRDEALAAASLDHPYICKVYEFIESGDETFIVMEFVEGETLSAMVRRGPLPVAQTIHLGREIAEGLAAAHGRGLVHRDVKPSNVMVTSHGHVKLLDFGLARIDVASLPGEATRTSPAHVTSYAGTPHYMSPEQASGKPITTRADLFSLGVVLYECLTGRLPFAGTSPYDYVRHLLSDAPYPLHKLAPDAPADLVHLIEQCLDKTPANRPASAEAVVAALRRLSESLTGSGDLVRSAAAARRRRRLQVLMGAAGVVVVGLLAWQVFKPAPPEIIRRSRPLISWPTEESGSRLSPDGQWIAFLSARGGLNQIFVQRLDGGEAKPVALPAGRPVSFVWSPDSNRLAVLLEEEGAASLLHIVPTFFGGQVLRTVTVGRALNPKLLRWIDGTVYAQIDSGKGSTRQLHAFTLEPEARRIVTESWSDAASLQGFDVSPDGTRVAFVVEASGQLDLFTANLDGTSRSQLTNDSFFERAPMWLGDGASVIFTSNRGGQIDLWEVIASTGQVRPLTQSDSQEFVESSSLDGATVSYQQQSADSELWLWDLAASKARQITAGSLREYAPLFSQSGGLMAFQQSQPNPTVGSSAIDSKLLVAPFDSAKSQLEPRPVADGYAASFSPDGAWIAYLQGTTGPGQAHLRLTQLRTGETRTLSSSAKIQSWSPRPLDWTRPAITWAGDALFYIDLSSPITVRRAQTNSTDPPQAIVTAKPNEMIEEVHAGPDPGSLTFMNRTVPTSTLYVVTLSTAAVRELGRLSARVIGRGWLPDRSAFVLTTTVKFNLDLSSDIDVHLIAPDGRTRTIGRIEHAFPATTRLDGERGTLFVTRSDDGIHNLYEFSMKNGAQRKITDNTIAEVTFSGATPVGGGKLIVVRDERKRDIWLMEARSGK